MIRTVSLLLAFVMVLVLTACGQSAVSEKQDEIQPTVQKTNEQSNTEVETELSESVLAKEQEADVSTKTLVVFIAMCNK